VSLGFVAIKQGGTYVKKREKSTEYSSPIPVRRLDVSTVRFEVLRTYRFDIIFWLLYSKKRSLGKGRTNGGVKWERSDTIEYFDPGPNVQFHVFFELPFLCGALRMIAGTKVRSMRTCS
jgi:hypothetical protein